MIRKVKPEDASAIANIYNYYIKNTSITFEENEVDEAEMRNRIKNITAEYKWFVNEENGAITGYCYASRWMERSAYRFTAELSVYVAQDSRRQGTGTALLSKIIEQCRTDGIHALISIITTPNEASVALHKKLGFTKAAEFKEVGKKFGKWTGVTYWEYIFLESESVEKNLNNC